MENKRCLSVLLVVLLVPVLAGFECNWTSISDGDGDDDSDGDNDNDGDGVWDPGDPCDPYLDSDENVCESSSTLLYCAEAGLVAAMDCARECESGYCGADPTGNSWDACICG